MQDDVKAVRYAAIAETSAEGPRWYIWRSGHGANYIGGKIADKASAEAIADTLTALQERCERLEEAARAALPFVVGEEEATALEQALAP